MRHYSNSSLADLIIKGLIALVAIVVLVQVFRAVFALVATLLTLAIIAIGIYLLIRFFGGRRRY